MRRDLGTLQQTRFDLAVIGGGITGACIAHDAALRGLQVALVERNDFGSATSAASSKLLHGGIRYLQHAQLGKVRESAQERAYFQAIRAALDPLRPLRHTDLRRPRAWIASPTNGCGRVRPACPYR